MENIFTYVFIFIIGLSVVYAYKWKKNRKRALPISVQNFSDAILEFLIIKQHGETKELLLKIFAKSLLNISSINIEIIDRKRNINTFKLSGVFNPDKASIYLEPGNSHVFHFQPDSLIKSLSDHKDKVVTFRFVMENDKRKKYKTHELAFNKNWSIYKPDSGNYN